MGRKASRARWRWQLAGAVLLAALLAGGWYWWTTRNFRPDEARWPDQGVEVAAADGAVEPMHEPQICLAWLVVARTQILLQEREQIRVAGAIRLHGQVDGLLDHEQVIVLI